MNPGHRLLFSIYITFMVYTIVSIVWGPSGVIQTSKLIIYKDKLVQNTIVLSQISSQLARQSDRLRTDQGLITLKARELGYFENGDGQIIIKGYQKNNINFSVGSYYKKFNKEISNTEYIRIFSSIIGLLVFLVLSVINNNLKYRKIKYH